MRGSFALLRYVLLSLFHDGHYRKSIRLNSLLLFKANLIKNLQQNNNKRRVRTDIILTAAGGGLASLNGDNRSKAATCSDGLTCYNAGYETATTESNNAKQPRI